MLRSGEVFADSLHVRWQQTFMCLAQQETSALI